MTGSTIVGDLRWRFAPLADITYDEIGDLVRALAPGSGLGLEVLATAVDLGAMPAGLRRHFEEAEDG